MKKVYLVFAIVLMGSFLTNAQSEMVKVASVNTVEATVKKLSALLESKGLHVFDVIDHQKGATSASMELRPTTLIIFGNPAVGTKLMNCDQTVGLDLPMKFLVYQDENAKTWISYWKPSQLADKYSLEACNTILVKMDGALAKFSSLGAE